MRKKSNEIKFNRRKNQGLPQTDRIKLEDL